MNVMRLFDLTGQTAIVTGGGRGIGYQMAEALAEAGANLVLCSRKAESCEEAAQRLRAHGTTVLAFACDITKQADVDEVVSRTRAEFDRLDVLINNSGATWGASPEEMPYEAWKKVIDVNVTGTFLMSQAVGKVMIGQRSGKIINIASVAGLGGTDPAYMDTIGYNTSKGAVITFTKDLAAKWGRHGITVNAIAPGFFPTKMSSVLIERGKEKILNATPLQRFGGDTDLKGAAVYLASKASDFVTGNILVVDGGVNVR